MHYTFYATSSLTLKTQPYAVHIITIISRQRKTNLQSQQVSSQTVAR